jgi:transcription antitermination factor NusA-like protein
MSVIKVGRLVSCCVVRELPGEDMYLVLIEGTHLFGYLPKRSAHKKYGEREECAAAVFMIRDGKIFLSQRSPQFFRRVVEAALAPAIRAGKIRVRRAASIANSAFAKVSVEGLGGLDPLIVSLQHLEGVKNYSGDTIAIVRYSSDIKEYIVNALVSAPVEKVVQVLYSQSLREAIVRVDPQYRGFFVGKGGSNVATAAKLLDLKILIKSTEQNIYGQGKAMGLARCC